MLSLVIKAAIVECRWFTVCCYWPWFIGWRVGGWLGQQLRGLEGADRVAADCRLETGRHKTTLKEQGVRHGAEPNGRPALNETASFFGEFFNLNSIWIVLKIWHQASLVSTLRERLYRPNKSAANRWIYGFIGKFASANQWTTLGGGCFFFMARVSAVNFHFFRCGGESVGGGFIGSVADGRNLWFPMKGKHSDVNYRSIGLFCETKTR